MPFYDTKCVFSQVRKSISEENSIYENLLLRNLTKKTSMESTLQYLSRQSIAIIQLHEEKNPASILTAMKNDIIPWEISQGSYGECKFQESERVIFGKRYFYKRFLLEGKSAISEFNILQTVFEDSVFPRIQMFFKFLRK